MVKTFIKPLNLLKGPLFLESNVVMHITEASLNTSAPRNRDGLIIIHLFFFKEKNYKFSQNSAYIKFSLFHHISG
jgi:hypothetical protein